MNAAKGLQSFSEICWADMSPKLEPIKSVIHKASLNPLMLMKIHRYRSRLALAWIDAGALVCSGQPVKEQSSMTDKTAGRGVRFKETGQQQKRGGLASSSLKGLDECL